jgi:hypothetical protein
MIHVAVANNNSNIGRWTSPSLIVVMTSKAVTQDKAKDTSLTYEQRAALQREKKRVITLKDGRTRIYTPPNSFPPKPIIEAARGIYEQLNDLGQDEVTVRTWYYNLVLQPDRHRAPKLKVFRGCLQDC